MKLIVEHTDDFCVEWVLMGKTEPPELFDSLKDFKERTGSFDQMFESHTFSFLKDWSETRNGEYLYYARFNGNLLFGSEIIVYLSQHFDLDVRALIVFVPYQKAVRSMRSAISDRDFIEKQRTGHVTRYSKKDMALFLMNEGIYLQIRGRHARDWVRLTNLLEQEVNLLRKVGKRKKRMKKAV